MAMNDFAERLDRVIKEFGSRYALAKATAIPASTLQSYAAGTKPGMGTLATLARVANIDVNWLLTGNGKMRPAGTLPGAALIDVLMVDQYKLGTALSSEIVVGQVPYSRHFLETRAEVREPSRTSLLVVEAGRDLSEIRRGDLVLVDREQANLGRDGVYLMDFPGIELRETPGGFASTMTLVKRDSLVELNSQRERRGRGKIVLWASKGSTAQPVRISMGPATKIIGRAVWISRTV